MMSSATRLPATASDPDPSRRNNLALIATLVHHHGVLSRAELTRRTGLNRSTVGTLVGQLVALGLVYEAAPSGEAQVGRPSPDVRPDPSTAALAVNPEVDAVTIGLVSLGGKVQKKIRFATERIPTAKEAVNIAAAVIAGMRSELDASYRIVGIGLAVPGLVNRADGVVRHAPHLGWRDEPVARMMGEATGYPCLADNDASLGAEAELIFGAGAGRGNLVYLNGGASGIGGGVIADGALLRGSAGYAGELGHTFVRTDGKICHCGASGCLETEVSQSRLFDLAGLGGGDASQLEAALRSKASAELAAEVARQLGYLGITLRNAVNTFNPDAIVLDGFLGILHALSPDTLDGLIRTQALDEAAGRARIYRAALGSDLMMIGAAELAFTRLLADPAGITALPAPPAKVR
ncbi:MULTISPECIES: ROK family transcriptional regulator [unclassified Pseudarthrobacter]|uniref:ROK family transcriptional regulator n=1 Tax=unclassified Pseudarthrobacter TaxID=2647000 RepID=UPI00113086BB|nr:ROK family transcriptional regulator [Pseudarthrobacter sp. NIBRBAC000502772]QDG66977.1 ROK family protein [Pseudarthrobacter sp. NIBRBAC000502772]